MNSQARAPRSQSFGAEAFGPSGSTELRWLGMAGFLVNSRGTTIMIDPLLEGFDMPVLIDFPLAIADVPSLDAVLVTHSDNDHYSVPTCRGLGPVTSQFHSTRYVGSLMTAEQLPATGHDIGERFELTGRGGTAGSRVTVTVTPADHAWQNDLPGAADRVFAFEDCCGFWLETPDGILWAPGDSRLISDHHLQMPEPDAMLFDFSDSEWHFGLEGAVRMANAYPRTPLLLHHWGCVDSPDFAPFNGDPAVLPPLIDNPERIVLLAPGEPYRLQPIPD